MMRILLGTGSALIALGLLFGWIQQRYYGQIDAQGVLHDSGFLPLAWGCILLGALLVLLALLRLAWQRLKRPPA